MSLLMKRIYDVYQYVNDDLSDPRTANWFLIRTPFPALSILILYLFFVLKWGPKWMKNRQPFNLDRTMLVYNAAQVIACTMLFIKAIQHAWGWNYKWICEPVDYSYHEDAIRVAKYVYFYFILKVIDLLDTIFFVLRKKNNQITFLHVYHHTGMVALTWGAVKYLPGGHGTLVGVINSFVHTVMYFYYFISIIDPSYKGSIWWKKYITQLQIIQFMILVLHFVAMVITPNCAYPKWVAAVFMPQNLFMLILFIDFYRKAYMRKPKHTSNGVTGMKQQNSTLNSNGNYIKNNKQN